MFRATVVVALLSAVVVECAPETYSWRENFSVEQQAQLQKVGRRQYSSGYTSGYSSGYTSGATPTAAPTAKAAAPKTYTKPVTIVQAIKFSGFKAAEYTGDLKVVCEVAVSIVYKIYDTKKKAYESGCSMASKVKARRADVEVEFTATVSATKAGAAEVASNDLAGGTGVATLTQALKDAKTATGKTVTLPTVKSIAKPTVTKSTVSGVSSTSSMCVFTLVASTMALFLRN